MLKIYHLDINNFGDAINPILVERLLGVKCCKGSKLGADIIGIGSILTAFTRSELKYKIKNLFSTPSTVWTSGFINEVDYKEEFRKNISFAALRGKVSKERVERITGKTLDIPLGDGGLLFSKLLDKQPTKKYSLGIVPHKVDKDNPLIKKLHEENPNRVIIDVRQPPLETLEQIASCDFVISTAMHGLIASDSLGIPNKWIEVSDKVIGNGYKFKDYYSVFENYEQTPYRLNETNNVTMQNIKQWQDEYNLTLNEINNISEKLYLALRKIEY
jgi:hypothetical protein